MNRSDCLDRVKRSRRVVIKVGTQLLTDAKGGVNRLMIEKLKAEILFLRKSGIEVLLVTSGAVGMGRELVRDLSTPDLARRQALSAIGQIRLMSVYSESFAASGVVIAQLLITARDFRDRRAYLNIGHTLQELISLGVLPVINENDTVSTDELRFGDNDMLSAACASQFHADLLIILTSVEGFIMNGKRVPFISRIGEEEKKHALGPTGPGSGGMETKIRAGELCALSGTMLAILPGGVESPIQSLFGGEDIGTLVGGETRASLSARKRWLLFARTDGSVEIDAGARKALERGSSLLPAGLRKINGHFLAGDVIDILDENGRSMGRGIVNYSYREILPAVGLRGEEIKNKSLFPRSDEIIHRNNMIVEIRAD